MADQIRQHRGAIRAAFWLIKVGLQEPKVPNFGDRPPTSPVAMLGSSAHSISSCQPTFRAVASAMRTCAGLCTFKQEWHRPTCHLPATSGSARLHVSSMLTSHLPSACLRGTSPTAGLQYGSIPNRALPATGGQARLHVSSILSSHLPPGCHRWTSQMAGMQQPPSLAALPAWGCRRLVLLVGAAWSSPSCGCSSQSCRSARAQQCGLCPTLHGSRRRAPHWHRLVNKPWRVQLMIGDGLRP